MADDPLEKSDSVEMAPSSWRRDFARSLMIVGALVVPGSFVFFFSGLHNLQRSKESQHWTKVSAIIQKSSYSYDGESVDLHIAYKYKVNGCEFSAKQVFFAGVLTRGLCRELTRTFTVGRTVEAKANPANFEEAVLLSDPLPGAYAVVWIPVVYWVSYGVALFLFLQSSARAAPPAGS